MKKCLHAILSLAVTLLAFGTAQAGEHGFGLRAGSFQFADSEVLTEDYELLRMGAGFPPNFTGFTFDTDYAGDDFDRLFYEFFYEYRRDVDSHFAMSFHAGYGSADSESSSSATVFVPRDPFDFNRNGVFMDEMVPGTATSSLSHTIYYVHFVPRYYFTTGKARFFMGAGVGLWANLWSQNVNVSWVDVLTCTPAPNPVSCPGVASYGERDGNRRTVVPFSLNAGLTWQVAQHWSLSFEYQYLFNADSNLSLFREESTYDIGGSQLWFGFAYQL